MIFTCEKKSCEDGTYSVWEIYKIPEIKYVAERDLCGNSNLDTIKTIFGVKQKSIKLEYPFICCKDVELKQWFRSRRLNIDILSFFIETYGYDFLIDIQTGSNLVQDNMQL